ncbi:MAG TPA: hypothetical protein VF692_00370 [Pyrinomonadaceae bacterium]|jgi:hypothetical protein
MTEKKPTLKRQIITAGGWQIAKRAAKSVPYLGTAMAIGLIGQSIRRKGVVKGVVNSGLDAIPLVGTAKNVVELFTGDLIPDKNKNRRPK